MAEPVSNANGGAKAASHSGGDGFLTRYGRQLMGSGRVNPVHCPGFKTARKFAHLP